VRRFQQQGVAFAAAQTADRYADEIARTLRRDADDRAGLSR
jgi:hypothetical protein